MLRDPDPGDVLGDGPAAAPLGSLWPAVLRHAAHDAFIQGYLNPLTADAGPTPHIIVEFGLALAGAIVGVIFRHRLAALGPAPAPSGAAKSDLLTPDSAGCGGRIGRRGVVRAQAIRGPAQGTASLAPRTSSEKSEMPEISRGHSAAVEVPPPAGLSSG
jgi:hypothetical protein